MDRKTPIEQQWKNGKLNLKRYDVFTCQCGCDNIDWAESSKGEWVKFSDIEKFLPSILQQNKNNTATCRIHDVNCTHWESGNKCGILPPAECYNKTN